MSAAQLLHACSSSSSRHGAKALRRFSSLSSRPIDERHLARFLNSRHLESGPLHVRSWAFKSAPAYNNDPLTMEWGHRGQTLKLNLIKEWWKSFAFKHPGITALDSLQVLPARVWRTSGHEKFFRDILVECLHCKTRVRVHSLLPPNAVEAAVRRAELRTHSGEEGDLMAELRSEIAQIAPKCNSCSATNWRPPRIFNKLCGVAVGGYQSYLRPEITQGAVLHFPGLFFLNSDRLPFGVGQVGKVFRNEIEIGPRLYRKREFEQAQVLWFSTQREFERMNDWIPEQMRKHPHQYWLNESLNWLQRRMGLNAALLKVNRKEHSSQPDDAQTTDDINFFFSHGWGSLMSVKDRGSADLVRHDKSSPLKMVIETANKTKIIPNVVEPTLGIDRMILALLTQGYAAPVLEAIHGPNPSVKPVLVPAALYDPQYHFSGTGRPQTLAKVLPPGHHMLQRGALHRTASSTPGQDFDPMSVFSSSDDTQDLQAAHPARLPHYLQERLLDGDVVPAHSYAHSEGFKNTLVETLKLHRQGKGSVNPFDSLHQLTDADLLTNVLEKLNSKEEVLLGDRLVLPDALLPEPISIVTLSVPTMCADPVASQLLQRLSKLLGRPIAANRKTASLGKKYYESDMSGCRFSVVVDSYTLTTGVVSVRERDTRLQILISIEELLHLVSTERDPLSAMVDLFADPHYIVQFRPWKANSTSRV